ncbi:MAG TPA: HIT family protein [Gemmatimonadaceae bacterium]|jgi:histidine triad (HIT) family protein|nr:HIT family protein [Gemmatimonadaceae bacterium]
MMDKNLCTFCNLIQGAAEVSVCHEDSDAIAFMDIQPVNNGHVLVVPREHYESLLEVPEDLGIHLFRVTMQLSNAVRRVSGCEDLNIVVSSGEAAGQDEPHFHVHIIPRRANDGFDIPLPFNGSAMPDRTVLDAYAARIIAALRDPMKVDSRPRDGTDRRSVASMERSVALPTYKESDRMKPGRSRPPAPGTARRSPSSARASVINTREGAHGELLPESSSNDERG